MALPRNTIKSNTHGDKSVDARRRLVSIKRTPHCDMVRDVRAYVVTLTSLVMHCDVNSNERFA
jgi:hypothetical protein